MMAIGAHANDHGRRTDSIPVQSAHPGRKGQLNSIRLTGGSQYAKVSRPQHYRPAHTASPSTTATSVIATSNVRSEYFQRSHGEMAAAAAAETRNQCGT